MNKRKLENTKNITEKQKNNSLNAGREEIIYINTARQKNPYLNRGELMWGSFDHRVHCMRHGERMRPVVVRHLPVILSHREGEPQQVV